MISFRYLRSLINDFQKRLAKPFSYPIRHRYTHIGRHAFSLECEQSINQFLKINERTFHTLWFVPASKSSWLFPCASFSLFLDIAESRKLLETHIYMFFVFGHVSKWSQSAYSRWKIINFNKHFTRKSIIVSIK